jgi:hypothetical protein
MILCDPENSVWPAPCVSHGRIAPPSRPDRR